MGSVNLQKANAVIDEVKKVVIGKDACIFKVMAAMIAGGHIYWMIYPVSERQQWHWHFRRQWICSKIVSSLHRIFFRQIS